MGVGSTNGLGMDEDPKDYRLVAPIVLRKEHEKTMPKAIASGNLPVKTRIGEGTTETQGA
jgi:hypothetical protein